MSAGILKRETGNNEKLLDRIEELEQQVVQLKKAIAPRQLFPLKWKLNRGENAILACLLASPNGFRSIETLNIVSVLVAGDHRLKRRDVLSARITSIRKKAGIKIVNRPCEGYYLPPDARAFIKNAMDMEW